MSERPTSERPICVGCATLAPETTSNHTLISARFGWRLTRSKLPDGDWKFEWRCSKCWRQHKATMPPSPPGNPVVSRTSKPPQR